MWRMPFLSSSTFERVAEAFGSETKLEQFLRAERDAGQSYEAIMFLLYMKTEIRVDGETVRRWCVRRNLG